MHWLWLGAIALMLLSLAVLLPPLLMDGPVELSTVAGRDEAMLRRLYQAQLAELEQDRLGARLSETDHAQALEELQRRLLSELDRPRKSITWRQSPWLRRGSALLLAVLLPVAAFALYLQVGDPKAAAQLAQEQPGAHGEGTDDAQVQAMVDGLARRLEEQPQNLPGWVMLARSYETLERYDAAAGAYRRALQEARRSQMDAEVQAGLWADLADALASAQGGGLDGEAGKAIAQALQLQPSQPKALALPAVPPCAMASWMRRASIGGPCWRSWSPDRTCAARAGRPAQAGNPGVRRQPDGQGPGCLREPPERRAALGQGRCCTGQPCQGPGLCGGACRRAPRPVAVLRLPAASLPAHFKLGPENLLDPAISLSAFPALPAGAAVVVARPCRRPRMFIARRLLYRPEPQIWCWSWMRHRSDVNRLWSLGKEQNLAFGGKFLQGGSPWPHPGAQVLAWLPRKPHGSRSRVCDFHCPSIQSTGMF